MQEEQEKLINTIRTAFSSRQKPSLGKVLYFSNTDNLEAIAVREFIHGLADRDIGNNRDNVVFDSLVYASPDTACFYIPIVMISLIKELGDSYELCESLYYALNRKEIINEPIFEISDYLTDQEKTAICSFSHWLLNISQFEEVRIFYKTTSERYCQSSI